MKASELVKKLQENIKQFGDLEVTNECDNLITGVGKEIVLVGDGESHFCLEESCIDVDEFGACVDSYVTNDGMNEEEARKAALEELEEYYS